jgi:hypothetical protein
MRERSGIMRLFTVWNNVEGFLSLRPYYYWATSPVGVAMDHVIFSSGAVKDRVLPIYHSRRAR